MIDLVYYTQGNSNFSFVDEYNVTIQLKNGKLFFSKTWLSDNHTFSIDPFIPEPYHAYMFYGSNNLSLYRLDNYAYNELPFLMRNLLLPFKSNMLIAFGANISDVLISLQPLIKKSQIHLSLEPGMQVNWIEMDPYLNREIVNELVNKRFNGFNVSFEDTQLKHKSADEFYLFKSKEEGFYELEIQKVDYESGEPLNTTSDLDLVRIGTSAGMLNATQVSLTNGKGVVRFYPMGYKGLMEIYVGRPYNYPLSKYTVELY